MIEKLQFIYVFRWPEPGGLQIYSGTILLTLFEPSLWVLWCLHSKITFLVALLLRRIRVSIHFSFNWDGLFNSAKSKITFHVALLLRRIRISIHFSFNWADLLNSSNFFSFMLKCRLRLGFQLRFPIIQF